MKNVSLLVFSFLFLISFIALPLIAAEDAKAPIAPVAAEVSKEAPKADTASQNAPQAIREDIKVPDISNVLFLQNLRRIGSTIYYLGESMGLNGWLVVKDTQVQILYTTPDQRAVLVGALLSAEGANISQQQIMLLANAKPEIAKLLGAGKTADVHVDTNEHFSGDANSATPKSEQLMAEVAKTAGVTFGKADAPHVYMIMDVNCPHCHAAWKKLEKDVDDGRLRLTLVPINALGPQSEVDGANLLNAKDPLDTWKKHVAGDKTILKIGTPDPDKEGAIFYNTQFAKKWNLDVTPYFVYRGKNGKVRLIMGEPDDAAAMVADAVADAAPAAAKDIPKDIPKDSAASPAAK